MDYSEDAFIAFDAMDKVCQYCNAYKYKSEAPGICYANGKIDLPELLSPPEPLKALVAGKKNLIYLKKICCAYRLFYS